MGLEFSNPIVAGTTLVRTAIKSPDYVPGVSGWSINKDGTAEFNNVTVRGTIIAGGGTVIIGSNGILITGANNDIRIHSSGDAEVDFIVRHPTEPYTYAYGVIQSYVDAGDDKPRVEIIAPRDTANSGTVGIAIKGNDHTGVGSEIDLIAEVIDIDTTIRLGPGGQEVAQGTVHGFSATTTSASVTTETVVATGAPSPTTFFANHVYEVSLYGLTQGTGGAVNTFRVRKTNATGQQLLETRPVINGNTPVRDWGLFKVGGSDISATLVVTLQATAAATWIAGASFPRGFQVKEVGSAFNPAYAGVTTLV